MSAQKDKRVAGRNGREKCFPDERSLICPPGKSMSFHKKETEKNWVSGQTWKRISVWVVPFSCEATLKDLKNANWLTMFMSLLVTVEPLLATCCLGGDPDLDPWLTTFVSLWLFSCDIDCELSLEGCFDWLTATTDSAAVEEATLRLEGAEESSPTPAGGAGVEADDDPLVISCCWAKLLLLLCSKVWSKTQFLLGQGCPLGVINLFFG